jgi:lipopolysaccharide/colanic/teichoic acid biosynthesis glycosyltransferase
MRNAALSSGLRSIGTESRKHIIQKWLAIALLLIFAPFLAAIGACIALTDGAPVLYRHRRVGFGGREFYCFKFRTMPVNADALLSEHLKLDRAAAEEWRATHKLRNDPRVTRMGRFLRSTSLDELPQLINVARGEMSFVGPRPIVQAEIAKYGEHFPAYCSVMPGITGLWQVSGRNDTSYEQRVALDVQYVRSRSLLLDCKILVLTLPAVILRQGSV